MLIKIPKMETRSELIVERPCKFVIGATYSYVKKEDMEEIVEPSKKKRRHKKKVYYLKDGCFSGEELTLIRREDKGYRDIERIVCTFVNSQGQEIDFEFSGGLEHGFLETTMLK
jgi:hypothetical protein